MSKRKYKTDLESKLLRKIKKALPQSMIYDINIDIKEVKDSKMTDEKKVRDLKEIIDELYELDDIADDYYEATKSENKKKKITLFKNYNKARIDLVNEAISQIRVPVVNKCPDGKIENPKTKRCIKANGVLAKKIGLGKIQLPITKPEKILNPKTGRYVNINGKIGKKLRLQKQSSSVPPPPPPKPQSPPSAPPMPKSSLDCNDVVTIPQYTGTCWFNAILMSLLYSQDSRQLLLDNNIYKTNKDKNPLYTIINDIIVDHYVDRQKGMKYFEKLKPEIIFFDYFKSNYSQVQIDYILQKGWILDIFLPKFIEIIGKTCLTLDEYNGEYYINAVKAINLNMMLQADKTFQAFAQFNPNYKKILDEIKEINKTTTNNPDYLFVNFNKKNNAYGLYDSFFKLLENKIKNLDKISVKKNKKPFNGLANNEEYITFNGSTYKLDSCLLTNYNKYIRGNHAIAGIICKDTKFVYNGWMRTTNDPSIAPDEKLLRQDNLPCELMRYDWDVNDPNKKFCLIPRMCNLPSISKTTDTELCFSFGKGIRTLVYVKVKSQPQAKPQPPPKPQSPPSAPPKPQSPPSAPPKPQSPPIRPRPRPNSEPRAPPKPQSPPQPPPKPSENPSFAPIPPVDVNDPKIKSKLEAIRKNIGARKITNMFKEFVQPFVNRISANIQSRISYYQNLFKILSTISPQQCLEFRNTTNGSKTYTIGNNQQVLASKQIGTASKNGVVFLSNINMKYKESYKFAIKVATNKKDNLNEVKILEMVSAMVLRKVTPHFPILYKTFNCGSPVDTKDYPKLVQKKNYLIILNELASGDLISFQKTPEFNTNDNIIINTFQQIYISILSFHILTKRSHNDCHWGNFLYHKVKAGGYIHYQIYDEDIYIENLGYLWVIWDFGLTSPLISLNNNQKDFDRIIYAFVNDTPKSRYGWVDTKDFVYSDRIVKLIKEVFDNIRDVASDEVFWDKLLQSSLYSNQMKKPADNQIINLGKPYILK